MEVPNEETFEGLDLKSLDIDQAFVRVIQKSQDYQSHFIYLLSEECHGCPYNRAYKFNNNHENLNMKVMTLSTHHPWNIRIRNENTTEFPSQFIDDSGLLCEAKNVNLGEFGVYDIDVSQDCKVITRVEPVNEYMAILYCTLILLLLGLLFRFAKWAVQKRYTASLERFYNLVKRKVGYEVDPNANESKESDDNGNSQTKSRVRSVDTFRGITIALMIFVNDGAGGYWFLEHAAWNGLQPADLVFPWFLWIMGVCIPMSIKSLQKRKTPKGVAIVGIFRRAMTLFLLGFFANTLGWIDLEKLRVPGVLQRFGITYFIVATTGVIFMESFEPKLAESSKWNAIKDCFSLWQRWIVAALVTILHCLLTFALPVPGCPTGYLGPGGLHMDNQYNSSCVGGAAGYIDRWILGINHIYSNPTPKPIYGSGPFDPEGILGSLTSVLQVFLGYQAGQIILTFKGHKERMLRFMVWSVLNAILGIALNGGFTQDHGPIPINKNLWSLSYVFVTTATAFFLMALVYALVDAYNKWDGEPFIYAGMNSIVLYLGHYVAWNTGPFNYISGPMNTHWDKLVESIWSVSAWLIVAYLMYRRKVFITV